MNNSDTVLGSTGSYWGAVLGRTGKNRIIHNVGFFLKWDVDYKPKHVIGPSPTDDIPIPMCAFAALKLFEARYWSVTDR